MALNTQRILEMAMHNDFEGITALCKQDILETAAKQKGGTSLVKRTKKAQKMLSGLDERQLSKCGAIMTEFNGKQIQQFSNGYNLFMLNEPLDGLPTAFEPLNANQYFNDWGNRIETPLDIPEIKAYLAECKAISKNIPSGLRTGTIKPYKIGNVYYNPQLLIEVMEILGGENIKFYQDNEKQLQAAFFESENGLALLLPVRPPHEADERKAG